MGFQENFCTRRESASVPASDVLTGVGQELRTLACGIDEIEVLVGNLVVAGAFRGSPSLFQLQSLDRMRQSLEGLADFLEVLSVTLPVSHVDASHAASVVKLWELGQRLSAAPGTAINAPTDCGDFEEFHNL